MKKIHYFTLLLGTLLISACAKEAPICNDIQIRAIFNGTDTRVCYSDNTEGGTVALSQDWQVGDKLVGWCAGNRFCYEVRTVIGGVAYLKWSEGHKLEGTETDVRMYYAPGSNYTDITSEGVLPVNITSQDADGQMPAILAASADFTDGSLTLGFANTACVLRLDRLCWLPANSTVSAIRIYGANSTASLSGTVWSTPASSAITLTREGGWNTDAFGEVTDTLRIAMLPSASASNITVKAVVEGTEYTVYRTPLTPQAGKYYYPAPVGARMVSGGETTYYANVEEAVAAANASASDAAIAMFIDHTIAADSLKYLNAAGKKISLDLGNCILTGKNAIWSEVEFSASGSGYAKNTKNVVVVRSTGNFTMNGSSLISTSTVAENGSAPLCVYAELAGTSGSATINGTALIGKSTYGAVYIYRGSLTVNGDAALSAKRAAFVSTDGSMTVNGGTFTSTDSQCIHIGASTTVLAIYGGTFSAATNLLNFNSEKAGAASVAITAGKFSWTNNFSGTYSGTNVSITGGIFGAQPPYGIAEGYTCVANTDPQTMSDYPYTVTK